MKNAYNIILVIACFLQLSLNTAKATTPVMLLRLEATGQSMFNETVVYFDTNGTFGYNDLYDAPSMGVAPGYLNILTRLDSIDFQIKCLPLLTQNMSIPVKVVTGVSGTYQIYAKELQNLPGGACVMLHDNLTNSDFDLRSGAYNCTISDTESVARFVLNFSISALSVIGNAINPTCVTSGNGYIVASGANGTAPWNYYWKDSLNNIIKTSTAKNTADTLFGLNAGVFSVDINTNGTCTNGTLTFSLQKSVYTTALYTTIADTLNLDNEGVVFTNKSTNAGSFWWDFGDGGSTSDTNATYNYTSEGTYTVTLTAFGSICADTSVYFKAITVVNKTNATTAIEKLNGSNNNMAIDRDANNYYVQFNYTMPTDAVISVTDLLGQTITNNIQVKAATTEKVYINTGGNTTQALIISVVSAAGEKVYRKVIN
ncbi:MAG TPA: PKD domain-containing protein [Bacteroidia bacterium]|nr:PKD domain-containing protein [Bacteroidia bacterium]